MCSNCSGDYEDPGEEKPIRLAPEQQGCEHQEVDWNFYRSLFICRECGAQIILPELAEALGYTHTE